MNILTNEPVRVAQDLKDYKSLDYMYSEPTGEINLADDNMISDVMAFLAMYDPDAVVIDTTAYIININLNLN